MIQSGIFDSSTMNIKEISNSVISFVIKRIIEISGIITSFLGILLMISLISFSPDDPNFIFPENQKIENILGFQGSYISDLLFQSIGLIAYLIPITFFITGINIFRNKKFLLLLENTFFIILYIIPGSLFFDYFYTDAFVLYINGNGGFVGNYINQNLFINLIKSYENFFYFFLIIFVITFFVLSINLNFKNIYLLFKKINNLFLREKNYTKKNEVISEYIPQEEIKNLIQEDLPFIKAETKLTKNRLTFKIPSIDLLKKPSRNENRNNKNENNDPKFLEKILLDFGVDGNIKKVSHGPVVTLNEFEPAAGVKVSKIINLSDDIARNTSSESARIATIPGSNTVGIELPNTSRENVYLSEILMDTEFKKKKYQFTSCFRQKYFGNTNNWRLNVHASFTNRWYNWIWKICMY